MRWGSGCPWARHLRRRVESRGSCHILPGVWLVSIRSGATPGPDPLCRNRVALASASASFQPGAAIGSDPLKMDSGGGASVAFAFGSAQKFIIKISASAFRKMILNIWKSDDIGFFFQLKNVHRKQPHREKKNQERKRKWYCHCQVMDDTRMSSVTIGGGTN